MCAVPARGPAAPEGVLSTRWNTPPISHSHARHPALPISPITTIFQMLNGEDQSKLIILNRRWAIYSAVAVSHIIKNIDSDRENLEEELEEFYTIVESTVKLKRLKKKEVIEYLDDIRSAIPLSVELNNHREFPLFKLKKKFSEAVFRHDRISIIGSLYLRICILEIKNYRQVKATSRILLAKILHFYPVVQSLIPNTIFSKSCLDLIKSKRFRFLVEAIKHYEDVPSEDLKREIEGITTEPLTWPPYKKTL